MPTDHRISYDIHVKCDLEIWPQGYKTFFMLNSAEHEISNAYKYKNCRKFSIFSLRLAYNAIFPVHKC